MDAIHALVFAIVKAAAELGTVFLFGLVVFCFLQLRK